MKTFYNYFGTPIAYTDDEVNIFSFNGSPLGYIDGDKIYAFSGKHLGWYIDGWIRDKLGYCVFFTELATGGPLKPIKRLKPLRFAKRIVPMKRIRQIAGIRPIKRLAWSRYYDSSFFFQ